MSPRTEPESPAPHYREDVRMVWPDEPPAATSKDVAALPATPALEDTDTPAEGAAPAAPGPSPSTSTSSRRHSASLALPDAPARYRHDGREWIRRLTLGAAMLAACCWLLPVLFPVSDVTTPYDTVLSALTSIALVGRWVATAFVIVVIGGAKIAGQLFPD